MPERAEEKALATQVTVIDMKFQQSIFTLALWLVKKYSNITKRNKDDIVKFLAENISK